MDVSAAEARKLEAAGRHSVEVAHDLRNVLTAILGFATLVHEKAREAQTKAHAEEIIKAAERAAVLASRLMSFGRAESMRPHALDLNTFLGEMLPHVQPLVSERVTVKKHLTGETLRVAADETQLEQVILSLVMNAADSMPAGGTLSVRTAARTVAAGQKISGVPVAPGAYAEIAISDTGRGMDTATLVRAFEPFFSTKPTGEGTGLGLSTAYGIVKNSRGYLWLESAPGCGTTVTVQLPRAPHGT